VTASGFGDEAHSIMPTYCAFHFKDPFKSAPGILAVPPKSDCGEAAKFPYQQLVEPDSGHQYIFGYTRKKVKIFIFFNENKHIKLKAVLAWKKCCAAHKKVLHCSNRCAKICST